MDFKVDTQEKSILIILDGPITSDNALTIQENIESIVWASGLEMPKLYLDLQEVEYITSAGLHALLNLKNKYQNVVIPVISEEALEALSYTCMDELFHLEETKALNGLFLRNKNVERIMLHIKL